MLSIMHRTKTVYLYTMKENSTGINDNLLWLLWLTVSFHLLISTYSSIFIKRIVRIKGLVCSKKGIPVLLFLNAFSSFFFRKNKEQSLLSSIVSIEKTWVWCKYDFIIIFISDIHSIK